MTYDNVADRATQVTDINGGTWTLPAPTSAGSSKGYRGAVLASHPNDYWPLDEASGTDAINVIPGASELGSDGDATYNNVTLGQPGPFAHAPDTAAGFNGTSSILTAPNFLIVDPTAKRHRLRCGSKPAPPAVVVLRFPQDRGGMDYEDDVLCPRRGGGST
ncbi:hypothetical protein, partial [Amycolatopsis alkalitolerans]